MSSYNITIYTSLYGITSLISMIITVIAISRGKNRLVFPLVLLMAASSWWTLCGAFESAAITQSLKVIWSKLEYAGTLSVPVFFLMFARIFHNHSYRIKLLPLLLLFTIPLTTLILAITNQHHHLIWSGFSSIDPLTNLMEYRYGWWFWIGTIGYSYILLFSGTVIFVRSIMTINRHFTGLIFLMILGLLLPWIGNFLYILKINPIPGLDLTRIAFTLTGVILLFAVLRLRLLDISPIAREMVIENMTDGLIVLDNQYRVADLNPAAKRILQLSGASLIGRNIGDLLSSCPDLRMIAEAPVFDRQTIQTFQIHDFTIRAEITPLLTDMGKTAGKSILLNDITSLTLAEKEVLQRDKLLQATTDAITKLLITDDPDEAILAALKTLGEAVQVDRVYIFENNLSADTGELLTIQRHEWVSNPTLSEAGNPLLYGIPYTETCPSWPAVLGEGHVLKGLVRDMPEIERATLEPQGIKSILVAPIFFRNQFWGFIGFDDCRRWREWTAVEEQILQTAAITLGTAYLKKRTEIELIASKEKAEASDRLKSTFLATMSHELRTPMNAIIGFSEIVDDNTSVEDLRSFLSIIHTSGKQLHAIIDDLFNISLIEAGELHIYKEAVSLKKISSAIHRTFLNEQKQLNKEHIIFYMNEDKTLDDHILYTDGNKLIQILDNLVRNAVKFTETGFVEFGYQMQGADTILFYVKDSGIGIPQDKMTIIFDKFRQVDDTHTRKYGGTGLGLAIAKNLATFLNGKLWVESEHGQGSVFYLSLPAPAENPPGKNQSELSTPSLDFLSGKTILLAEDEESNYQLIKTYFRHTNAIILWVTNGREAIDMIRMRPEIDLVLMDLKMPQMDGYESTKWIKSFRPDLPVIAMTAHAMFGDLERTIQHGFNNYIAKPVSKKMLFRLIAKHFST